jgi:hypothetical protein
LLDFRQNPFMRNPHACLVKEAVLMPSERLGFRSFVGHAARSYKGTLLASSLAFSLLFCFMVGVIYFFPVPVPGDLAVPSFYVITKGPFLQVPWVVIYLNRYMALSLNPEAALSLALLSGLFGLNVAAYRFARNRIRCSCERSGAFTALGALASFLAAFSCCGAGLLLLLLSSAGFWALVSMMLATLFKVRYAVIGAAAWLMLLSLYLTYRRAAGSSLYAQA